MLHNRACKNAPGLRSRKRNLKPISCVFLALSLVFSITGCSGAGGSKAPSAKEDKIVTYGQPDDWANWKEMFAAFNKKYGSTHVDTDMSSAEEIQKFGAEKNNPVADTADIGMMWGPVAVSQGVTMGYKNANWDKIGDWAKDPDGNWFGTYVGVPVFLVNTDVVKDVPQSWNDLLKSEYKDMICIANPQTSGSGQNMVLAAAYALGGDITKVDASIDYFAKLQKEGNIKNISASVATLQKGEVPIYIVYDFLAKGYQEDLKGQANFKIVFPKEGSIWAPSALMINKWSPHPGLAKKFADFVSSDEGQAIFAEGHAHPIRYVEGNLKLPDDVKSELLPDSFYTNCGKPSEWNSVSPDEIAQKWGKEVLGQ
ncbi:extracellular solute-binding protein [Caproicibacter sp.]|uniref:extracellular solute-binding protein n=1 Tax=Caproicibacter sp. TaxID=2814884 RepID=UPI003988F400